MTKDGAKLKETSSIPSPPVGLSEGRFDAPLLVVLSNKPTEGMEAWLHKVLFTDAKIVRTDVRFVYMLDEPPKGSGGKPLIEQTRKSWDRFAQDIKDSIPDVVLCLGSDPLYYLTGIREGINDSRGYVITKKYFRDIEWRVEEVIGQYKTNNKTRGIKIGDDRYGFVTKNFPGLLGDFEGVVIPSYQLDHIRTSQFTVSPAFKEDVKRAARAIRGELKMVDKDFKYFVNAGDICNVEWGEIIAVDIETLGMENDVIDRVSISDGQTTASIPWNTEAIRILNNLFSNNNFCFALHNSGFDLPRLKEHGINITKEILDNQIFDTMYGAVMLQPDLLKGLGPASSIYMDVEPWKWTILSKADPIFYSAKDAYITAILAKTEIATLKNMGMWDLVPTIMSTIPVLTDLGRRGIKTNREYANWWVSKLERRLLRLERLWSAMFPGVNPHSTKQIQEIFYGEWGLPVQKSKKDTTTTDELAMIKLRHYVTSDYAMIHDNNKWREDSRCTPRIFDLVLKIRDAAKTINTYVQPVALDESNWVYPRYLPASKDSEGGENIAGKGRMVSKGNTSTGRLATWKPNIGNQPKKVRKIYVPDNDEMCFIQADWKMAELYVFAYTAGDHNLISDLKKEDFHSENAKRFGITRDVSKNVLYASQYLAGPSKVNEMILAQEHIYVPVDECRRIMEGYKELYSEVTALKYHIIKMCETKHYIRNPFGYVRTFPSGEAPAAVDFWCQSTVAHCLWHVLKPVAEMAEKYNGRLTTTVYDSIVIQVPKDNVEAAAREMKTLMQRTFDNVSPGFYIPVELEIGAPGASWGDLKKVK